VVRASTHAFLGSLLTIAGLALSACQRSALSPSDAQPSSPRVNMSANGARISRDLRIVPLVEGVYVVIHELPSTANSLLVVTASGDLVLVDTPYTADATRLELGWLEAHFGRRPVAALNTHFHLDRAGGNEALIAAGIPVYGSERTVRMLAERGEQRKGEVVAQLADSEEPSAPALIAAFRGARLVPPDHVLPASRDITLTLGGERLVVHDPGPAHSPDNVVVFFPRRQVLFAGCMIKSGDSETMGNVADADLGAWPAALANVRAAFPNAARVVPGHGAAGGMELLDHTRRLLERR
jgi:metallo-beta-lactamase class B